MRVHLSIADEHGLVRDVGIDAPPGTPLAELADALGRPDADFWSGARRVPPTAAVGGPALRDGALLHVGRAGRRDLAAGAVLRLHVVGGPDAGLVTPLPRGLLTVGRAADCDVTLTDPNVSRRHAAVTVSASGITLRDLGSTNGTAVNREAAGDDGTLVHAGDLIRVGDSLLAVCAADEPVAALRPAEDGTVLVNRPPRLSARFEERVVDVPARRTPSRPQPVQWLAALLPAAAGVALALVMDSMLFLAFAALSPLVLVATAASDRFHWRRERRREARAYKRRAAEATARVAANLADETAYRRRAHPDPAAVLRTATVPDARLWERRRRDPDNLTVRLGTTDLESYSRARTGTSERPAGSVRDVPLAVPLRAGPLGLCGPRAITLGLARWVLAQLAVMHSPADVEFVLLPAEGESTAWRWARWLPHVARVAVTPDEWRAVVAALLRIVEARLAERRADPDGWTGTWTVLVLDRCGAVADLPGLGRLLAAGPAAGVTAVCLDDSPERLPSACAAVAVAAGDTGTHLIVRATAGEAVRVLAERVNADWSERVARALAPMRDAVADAAAGIPASCRLLDVLDLDEPTPQQIAARWAASDHRPAVRLAVGAEGPLEIDLVRDGPHALVAGTTGSGKSELLQSLVVGLAAEHPPEAVSFVLVDYKGGAAFGDCARLPHTAGLVTDLDAHLTQRALRSFDAELRRREVLFAATGAKDLADYRRSGAEPLPRLILVVDEFAALAEELPDFVTGLVGIAQRGRSLGVHLVLATQRPGGCVSPEIRANTALRIALRVTDAGESCDVVGTDDASSISPDQPGRLFVRTGAGLLAAQAARVGGAAVPAATGLRLVTLDDWCRPQREAAAPADGKTDLQMLVDAAREAALRTGRPAPRRPWLPPLPTAVPLSSLDGVHRPAFGLVDLPEEQAQWPLTLDPLAGSALLVVGGPRSGRSTALRTLAAAVAGRLGPDELHMHVIDCAGGALRGLAQLPHLGTFVGREDVALVERLLERLTAEVTARQAWLAAEGLGSVREACDAGRPLPACLVLLDGWEAFASAADDHNGGRAIDLLLALLRDCASAGLTAVITGDRGALANRLASLVANKLVLRLSDRGDYALAGLSARDVPEHLPPGRALRAEDAAELQIAHLGDDPSTAAQGRALALLAAGVPPRNGPAAITVRPLPAAVRLADLPAPRGSELVLGAGGDGADPVTVDLLAGAGARLIVAGPPRSGRSTVLTGLLTQAVDTMRVVVAAPASSPLHGLARDHALAVLTPQDVAVAVAVDGPAVVLVDDSEAFLDTPAGDTLAALVRSASAQLAWVVAGRSDDLAVSYRGLAAEVKRSRTGLLLQPGPGDGDLLGITVPRGRTPNLPGRGILLTTSTRVAGLPVTGSVGVQVATP